MKRMKTVKVLLAEALISLMHTTAYHDITITDIAEEAGVSRKSYYRNYNAKEEVLYAYLAGITDQYLSNLPAIDSHRTLEEIICTFLEHMKKQDKIARLLYNNNLFYLLEEHICGGFLKRYRGVIPAETAYFIAGACFQLYRCWLNSDYQMTSDELAMQITQFMKAML